MPIDSSRVAIVADDLTGAADTAAGFLGGRRSIIVTWLKPELDAALFDRADVLAIDIRTRAATAARARETTGGVVRAMSRTGASLLYKKIDSTLRGHVGEEIAATLQAWSPESFAVVAPAFPAAGRTTVDGCQRILNAPLDQPAVTTLLERAGVPTAHVDLTRVRDRSLEDALESCRARGSKAVVCDAESDEDLRLLARAGGTLGPRAVWVGSGGLAAALADVRYREAGEPACETQTVTADGPILIVVGSASDVARRQADHLLAAGAAPAPVPVRALDESDAQTGHLQAIEERLRERVDVVVTLEPREHSGAGPRVVDRLGDRLRRCATLVGGLVVTGGDTALAMLSAWEITALRLVGLVEPGVPVSVSIGRRQIPIVTKAGTFGGPETLTHARDHLRSRR